MTIPKDSRSTDAQVLQLIKTAEHNSRGQTLVLGGFGIAYGILTFTFGKRLWWDPSVHVRSVYENALTVPGAPQTWGVISLSLGLAMLVGLKIGSHKVVAVGSWGLALWSFVFCFTFVIDSLDHEWTPVGLPAALILGVFWLLYVLKALNEWRQHLNPLSHRSRDQ
ncbi:hypothetical protein PP301_gp040 [Gordonia phage GMA2]|uniref:Uncharacterized protein n=1 Tax=Gordonia phage GMA2 TaxID=1647283 RepID=A0A0K0N750_9CAUD|nr:hypothetical protein PP301_gp040 [Gordonia phage GMA2]AKJ72578.1 hypothetical protein GMA2_40 [Gordonia phage GMA2]